MWRSSGFDLSDGDSDDDDDDDIAADDDDHHGEGPAAGGRLLAVLSRGDVAHSSVECDCSHVEAPHHLAHPLPVAVASLSPLQGGDFVLEDNTEGRLNDCLLVSHKRKQSSKVFSSL